MSKKIKSKIREIVKVGYVGNELVKAFIFDGMDVGLSHYYYKGKTYVGTVKFTKVISSVTKIIT